MYTVDELTTIPENQIFDRKSIRIEPKALAIQVVAFANADGGTIAIGISDDGHVEGVNRYEQKVNEILRVPLNIIKDIMFEGPILHMLQKALDFVQTQIKEYTKLHKDARFHTIPEYPEFVWIARYLRDYKFVRELGEGVDRMYRELLQAGFPAPEYKVVGFMTILTVKKIKSVNVMEEDRVGINDRNIRNNISVLKQKDVIRRIGPDKGGHWEVNKI